LLTIDSETGGTSLVSEFGLGFPMKTRPQDMVIDPNSGVAYFILSSCWGGSTPGCQAQPIGTYDFSSGYHFWSSGQVMNLLQLQIGLESQLLALQKRGPVYSIVSVNSGSGTVTILCNVYFDDAGYDVFMLVDLAKNRLFFIPFYNTTIYHVDLTTFKIVAAVPFQTQQSLPISVMYSLNIYNGMFYTYTTFSNGPQDKAIWAVINPYTGVFTELATNPNLPQFMSPYVFLNNYFYFLNANTEGQEVLSLGNLRNATTVNSTAIQLTLCSGTCGVILIGR